MKPIISVVTVCYNSEKTIKKTIDSVLRQGDLNFEYIIVDGKSSDATVTMIEEYMPLFKGKLRYVSESDNGWYDAMNKGVKMSEGHFINFLNSDDYYDEGALAKVIEVIEHDELGDDVIVYGDSTNVYRNKEGKELFKRISAPEIIDEKNKGLQTGMCGIRHQSMFVGREVYRQVGLLNLQYRLHADWDFMIKTLKAKVPYVYINENLTFYSMYGVSTKIDYKERHLLRKDNELYNCIDWTDIREKVGIKAWVRRILGGKKWNEFLFLYHKRRGN